MRKFFWSLIILVVIIGIGWAGYTLYRQYERVTLNFGETYSQAESLIKERKYEEAYEALSSLSRVADTEEDWQKILKQAYELSVGSGQYSVLSTLAGKASDAYPANELFWAFRVYAGLRVGAYDVAYEWATTYLTNPTYEPLRREALLGHLWGSDGEAGFFSRLQAERNPLIFEQMGDILNSAPFFYNASLLYLREGNVDAVHRIFEKISQNKIYTRSFAFLGYQTKDWDWVLENLNYLGEEDADILLLMGDVYLMKRDYQNASYVYEKIISEYPEFHVTPYVNQALLLLARGDNFQALDVMEKGQAYFSESPDFVRYYALILNGLGRSAEALSMLEPWLGQDAKIDLLSFNLAQKDSPLSVKTSALWQMWQKNEGSNKELSKFMLFEFAKLNLWYDFDLLASRLPNSLDHDTARLLAYRDFHNGNLDSARSKFFEGVRAETQAGAYYNAGLIYYYQNDFAHALDYFNRALDAIPFKGIETARLNSAEKSFLGKLYFFKGYAEYHEGQEKESRLSFEQAINFDNKNAGTFVAYYNLFPQE